MLADTGVQGEVEIKVKLQNHVSNCDDLAAFNSLAVCDRTYLH